MQGCILRVIMKLRCKLLGVLLNTEYYQIKSSKQLSETYCLSVISGGEYYCFVVTSFAQSS